MEKESKSLDDYIEPKKSSLDLLFSSSVVPFHGTLNQIPGPTTDRTAEWWERLKYDQIKVDFDRNKPEWTILINKHSEAEVKDQGTIAVSMLVDKELNENREIRKLNTRVDIQQE